MGLFAGKRGGVDLVDFTKTKHGKPIPKPAAQPGVAFDGSFLDLTQSQQNPISQSSPSTMPSSAEAPSTFGFLTDFAQAAASSDSSSSFSTSSPDVSTRLTNPDAEVSALRLKVDDLEYKIERLLERIAELEMKSGRI